MPGEPWSGGDEFSGGQPTSSLQIVWHKGRRWAFVGGDGGVATAYRAYAFDVSQDGTKLSTVDELKPGPPYDLCTRATRYLNR